MGDTGTGSGGARDGIVLLLSGEPERDRRAREALAGVDGGLSETEDPEAALAAIEDGAVLAVGAPGALAAVGRLAVGEPAPAGEAGEDRDEAAVRPSAGEGGPTLQIRRPARFSARPLHAEAAAFVRTALDAAGRGEAPEMGAAKITAERLHTSLLQSNLLLLRALEPYKRFDLATHCTNVAIIAGKIALGLDWPLEDTLRVLQAGLLHDLGMMRLPERILAKEGTLTPAEREEMQEHPRMGAELLEPLGPEYAWLRRAVLQEHERRDGQGYPEGLAGDDIDPAAAVLGVADVFEAFSHARSYRSPFTAYEALEKVLAMRGERFRPDIVDALANEISVFPLDSYVLLSTGEIGRVVATNPENLMRPTVEVLWDAAWNPVSSPARVQLAERPEVSVTRPLHEAEVPIT